MCDISHQAVSFTALKKIKQTSLMDQKNLGLC